jgi:predicted regulator of Ras-like GTPase activity (Roadblock/LC7/MglB family)
MRKILQQIHTTPGVIGSLVCDLEGRLIAELVPPSIDKRLVAVILNSIKENSSILNKPDSGIKKFDLPYDDTTVVAKAFSRGFLLLFCARGFNRSTIQIALNKSAQSLEAAREPMIEEVQDVVAALPKPASPFLMPMNISPFGNYAAETYTIAKDTSHEKKRKLFEFTMPKDW